jgi:hypothetical protein
MGSTSLDSRVLSSAELRVSGESMEKGVITADVATHEEVTESRELFAGERFGEEICSIQVGSNMEHPQQPVSTRFMATAIEMSIRTVVRVPIGENVEKKSTPGTA